MRILDLLKRVVKAKPNLNQAEETVSSIYTSAPFQNKINETRASQSEAKRSIDSYHPVEGFYEKDQIKDYNSSLPNDREMQFRLEDQNEGRFLMEYEGSPEYFKNEKFIMQKYGSEFTETEKKTRNKINADREKVYKDRQARIQEWQNQSAQNDSGAEQKNFDINEILDTSRSLQPPPPSSPTFPDSTLNNINTINIPQTSDLLPPEDIDSLAKQMIENVPSNPPDSSLLTETVDSIATQLAKDTPTTNSFHYDIPEPLPPVPPPMTPQQQVLHQQNIDNINYNDMPQSVTPLDGSPPLNVANTTPETPILTTQRKIRRTVNQPQQQNTAVTSQADDLLTKRKEAQEARVKANPNYARLNNDKELRPITDDGSISHSVFLKAMEGKEATQEKIMLQNELIGAARNDNPETVNQRIDFYKNQGAIGDKEAEPLKAFFNSSFDNIDEAGVEDWFKQYNENISKEMTPRQARLSVNQEMNNKREGFFSSNSEDNFKNFAGRAVVGGMFGAAIGSATDDNPEAGFVAGVVGASVGKNIAGMLRNNTDMFEGKMINSLLKDTAKGKTRPQQLEAVEDLDDEALDFMDKMYKDKLTNNFGTKNMFENSALTSSRSMTLGGAALAGVAFTPKKRDHRRGFNANRGNRI